MRFRLERVMKPFARALQRAYARVIRSGAPRVPHEGNRGPVGGSLAQQVTRPDLVRHKRWGFVFSPSRLGHLPGFGAALRVFAFFTSPHERDDFQQGAGRLASTIEPGKSLVGELLNGHLRIPEEGLPGEIEDLGIGVFVG